MVMSQLSRRERSKTASRARIIKAAIRLFSDRNIDGVTVDDIAAAADVGKGTIYNYFRTKEDIVVAFMADFEREVQAKLRDLDTTNRSLAETLTQFIRLQFQLKEPHHHFVRIFFAQMFLRTHQFGPYMAEIHQLMRSTTETLLLTLQKQGTIRADLSVDDLTLVFINLQFGLSALWAIEGPPFRATDYAVQREITLFCEGLETRNR
jgi:AcrR family transcriptional regulator